MLQSLLNWLLSTPFKKSETISSHIALGIISFYMQDLHLLTVLCPCKCQEVIPVISKMFIHRLEDTVDLLPS